MGLFCYVALIQTFVCASKCCFDIRLTFVVAFDLQVIWQDAKTIKLKEFYRKKPLKVL